MMTKVQQGALFGSLLVFFWLFTTYEQILSMEAIWRKSDTFAHGYFILPISLWLCWRDKHLFDVNLIQPSFKAIIPLALSLVGYVFAYAADINAVMQLMTVSGLISIIWLIIGDKLAWRYKFPLAFLLFAVPVGQNLIPILQDITAWFTVFFLKLTGIPVFRDGWYIQTPTGLFEVAVACSGIRYLIASAAVGALFAYLTYTSFKKQILFFLFACTLPILANGLRAYFIVIIAHYSDMKYATGADHLVYGWFFFGFVIMFMFWIGGKFADPQQKPVGSASHASLEKFSIHAISIAFLLLLVTMALKAKVITIEAPAKPTPALTLRDSNPQSWNITYDTGLQRSLVSYQPGTSVLVAHYGQKQTQGELISWHNILFERDNWTIVDKSTLVVGERKLLLVSIRNARGQERTLAYGYRIGERWLTNPVMTKVVQAIYAIVYPESNASIYAILVNNRSVDLSQLKEIFAWIDSSERPLKSGGTLENNAKGTVEK